MKTIWIVDHYSSEPKYNGISRQYDFALELAKQGYHVVIISSAFSHFTHTYITNEEYDISEVNKNVHYVYIKTKPYESNDGLSRIINIFSFEFAVQRYYQIIAKKLGTPDVVTGCSVHPLAWIVAKRIAKKYKARYCVEVRDLWPEMWLLNGEKKPYDPIVLFFGAIEKWAFKNADRIIYSMVYGDRYICDKLGYPRNKTFLIGQPMDCERYDFNAEFMQKLIPDNILEFIRDSFYCVFTGYYMEYEGVYPMLEAAKILHDKNLPIKMVFVGSGKEKEGMVDYVNKNHLCNVLIGDRISKEAIPSLLRQSAICLAHCSTKGHDESFKYGVSKNKVNEYLYANSCVVYGFSDSNDAIATSGSGYVIEPFSGKKFAERIEQVYNMTDYERGKFGLNGKKYIEQNHKVQVLATKLISVLFD